MTKSINEQREELVKELDKAIWHNNQGNKSIADLVADFIIVDRKILVKNLINWQTMSNEDLDKELGNLIKCAGVEL